MTSEFERKFSLTLPALVANMARPIRADGRVTGAEESRLDRIFVRLKFQK